MRDIQNIFKIFKTEKGFCQHAESEVGMKVKLTEWSMLYQTDRSGIKATIYREKEEELMWRRMHFWVISSYKLYIRNLKQTEDQQLISMIAEVSNLFTTIMPLKPANNRQKLIQQTWTKIIRKT